MRKTLNGKLIAISYSRDGMKGNFPLIKMRDQLKVKEIIRKKCVNESLKMSGEIKRQNHDKNILKIKIRKNNFN